MKATLEFSLTDSQEREELNYALKGHTMWIIITETLENLRQKRKYGQLPEDQVKLIEKLETEIRELILDRKVLDLFN